MHHFLGSWSVVSSVCVTPGAGISVQLSSAELLSLMYVFAISPGRARQGNANYYLLANPKDISRDRENRMKQRLEDYAIHAIREEDERTLWQKIKEIQTKAYKSRRLEELKRMSQQVQHNNQRWRLLCYKCGTSAVHASDIESVKNNLRIVRDEDFKKEYSIERKPDLQTPTIHCKKCGYRWGDLRILDGNEVPSLSIERFGYKCDAGQKHRRKWKDVPQPKEYQGPTFSDSDSDS